MDNHYTHYADLVAFVKPADLPPSLYSFVESLGWRKDMSKASDKYYVVLKIKGTTDSYHAIMFESRMGIEQIEEQLHADLGVVELGNEARKELEECLALSRRGEFVHYLNHSIDPKKYPYRH
ncbi:MAG: DUF749 family protein [bacterium]